MNPYYVAIAKRAIIAAGITPTGEVTVKYLEMNSPAQVVARQLWIRLGLFP